MPAKKDKTDKSKAPSEKPVSPKVPVLNSDNETVREIQLAPSVFGGRVNAHLVYEAVKQYRAGGRRGTHKTKTRGLVAGSGRKPWRQKGTGRARVGEVRTPLWRHGGTVFGPQPRDYSYSMPKKARAAALRSALAQRLQDGALTVVEGFAVETPKTRVLKGLLEKLGVFAKGKTKGKAVIVEHEPAEALVLSSRNLAGVQVIADSHLNAYHALDCAHLLMSQEAVEKLEERLTPEPRG